MSDTSLIFNLLAIDSVTQILGKVGGGFDKLAVAVAASAVDAGYHMLTMAGDFQEGITQLSTGAGEAQSNLGMVSQGILDMAGQVGESTKQLSDGMYLVESAGFHGANGLTVLKDAAEGAKVGNADLAVVADAVTTGLNAYHEGADQAAAVTNALTAAVSLGKSHMSDLAGSLATVAPAAAVAGVQLNEVLAAEATMTAQGTAAADSATYLRQTILQLSNPTAKARNEMESLGLDATQVSDNLGKNGLAATLTELTDAIQSHMGPAGDVLIEKLRAASTNATQFQQIQANLPPTAQTYIAALADMVGGTKSMQAALELTGGNMATFQADTAAINDKVKAGGSSIEGWSEIQGDFNVKLAQARGSLEAVGIEIGLMLIPAVTGAINLIGGLVGWFEHHRTAAVALAIAVGVLAAVYAQLKLAELIDYVKTIPAALNEWARAQWALDAAMDSNVLALIIIGIAALIVVIAYLWTHSQAFRDFMIHMWNDIWGFLKEVGAWFAGPFVDFFVDAGQFFVRVWNDIWGFLKTVGDWFAGPFVNFFVSWYAQASAPFIWLWHNVIEPAFNGIAAVIEFNWRIISSIFNLFKWVTEQVVGAAVTWLWHTIIKPVVDSIVAYFQFWGSIAVWLWQNVMVPSIHGIADLATWLWSEVIHPVIDFIVGYFQFLAATAMWLWHNAVEPAMHGIGDAATWLWHSAIEPAMDGIGNAIKWVYNNIIQPTWDALTTAAHAVGDGIRSAFDGIGDAIGNAFSTAVGIVKGIFNGIIGLINDAIGSVNSLIDTANKVPGVNFPHLPSIPALAAGGTATRGGLALVGEQGAEVVRLNSGDTVYPHGTGPGGGGGGDTYVTNNIYVNGIDKLKDLLDFLENRKNNGRRGLGMA